MANVKINAVGDQCPVPVVKATKALKEFREAGTLERTSPGWPSGRRSWRT